MNTKESAKDGPPRRRTGITSTWLILALLAAVSLTAGACAVFLPDSPPSLLASAKEVTSAPAAVQDYRGEQDVTLIPVVSAKRDLLINVSGTVTASYGGNKMESGKATVRVNDRSILAIHTDAPLYRDLHVGDHGFDVQGLNKELSRLGYGAPADSPDYARGTAVAVKKFMESAGNASDGNLSLADVIWIPAKDVVVSDWQGVEGASLGAGSPIGHIPGAITSMSIKAGKPSDQDRDLTVFGETTTLKAGSVVVDDPEFCRKVSATEDFRNIPEPNMTDGFDASISLHEPVKALRVPASAVFGVKGNKGCIADGQGRTVKVKVVGSQLGVSLVTTPEGGPLDSVSQVALGQKIANRSCS